MGFLSNFFSNLAAALWMLLGSTKAFSRVKPTFAQFAIFLILAISANILFAYLAAPSLSFFNEQGLISYLVWPAIILVAGIILAKRSLNYSLLFVPVILWLTADTLLVLLQSLIQFLENESLLPYWLHHVMPTLFALLFVWQTTSLLWIFAKRLHWPWWERVLMLVATIALLLVWQRNVVDQPIFKEYVEETKLSEAQFFAQAPVMQKSLDNITRSRKGVSEWYFLGVASYAEQDVFMSEILQARQLFDVKFGTAGHSMALINNPNTWFDYPIASRASIEQSLNAFAKKMDTDEDVLFLALSSHGVVDEHDTPLGELAVTNEPLDLPPIDPYWLKSALDNSGIRWRVIVVSACYAGTFIDALKDPYTLIITASRADRASFGCTNDADLTYFGRAFFAEGMREQQSFDGAFLQAVRRVGERETLMGFEPSEPQRAIGEVMQKALPELEKALFLHDTNPVIDLQKALADDADTATTDGNAAAINENAQ
ncbi:C13 family peptidase [Moraxella sp. FZLJ2109]|uniref:C13 family peptidase n=1 Tax=unclassified Moraxella TaxID=2685852 RepID=UPI003531C2AA